MHSPSARGMTLIELLVVLTIISILLVAGSHGLGQLLEKQRADERVIQLSAAIQTARSLASSRYQRLGICAHHTDGGCDPGWSTAELALFIDVNRDGALDNSDEIVRYLPWNGSGATIKWTSWLRKPAIVLQPDGSALSNGTLLISDQTTKSALALILNKGGRLRVERRKID